MSGRHARVVKDGAAFIVEDLNSTNGTFVNDRAVARHTLVEGDVVQIGQHAMLLLWVYDLASRALLYEELVAHGQGSGATLATQFSNDADTHRSSLGLFVTRDAYVGKNGYSLRLDGLDDGINDQARARAIVMHGAAYVSAAAIKVMGRLGRSWGCPAVSTSVGTRI